MPAFASLGSDTFVVPKRPKMGSQNGPNGPQNGLMLTLGVFGRLGGHFGAISEASWGSLGGVRERLGRVSGELGGVWGASCARLGAAWGGLGTSWGAMKGSWERLGPSTVGLGSVETHLKKH